MAHKDDNLPEIFDNGKGTALKSFAADAFNAEKMITEYIDNLPEDAFVSNSCKLCKSKFKAEAEKEYEAKNRNARAAWLFLTDIKKEDISAPAVTNHFNCHYKKAEKMVSMKEYLTDLKGFAAAKRAKEHHLQLSALILEERLLSISAESKNANFNDQLRAVAAIKTCVDGLIGVWGEVDKMREGIEPVEIVIQRLRDVVSLELKTTNNPEAKKLVSIILDKFAQSVKDITVGGDN